MAFACRARGAIRALVGIRLAAKGQAGDARERLGEAPGPHVCVVRTVDGVEVWSGVAVVGGRDCLVRGRTARTTPVSCKAQNAGACP